MLSAFGVDHGEISKRKRSTKEGAKLGAEIGAGVGGGAALLQTPRTLRNLKAIPGMSRGARGAAVAGGVAGATAFHGGLGAGIGAAIGRKKKGKGAE